MSNQKCRIAGWHRRVTGRNAVEPTRNAALLVRHGAFPCWQMSRLGTIESKNKTRHFLMHSGRGWLAASKIPPGRNPAFFAEPRLQPPNFRTTKKSCLK